MTYAYARARWLSAPALAVIVLAFLGYSVPPYLSGGTRVPATFALHYPLLVGHVMFASAAMLCAVAQLWFTINGYLAARNRRFTSHRLHMIRSATLALSIITNRIWTPILFITLYPLQDSVFGGNQEHFLWVVAGIGAWLGWTIPMLAVQWWLQRKPLLRPSSVSQHPDMESV